MVLPQIQWLCLPHLIFCVFWQARVELALFVSSVYFSSFKCMLWCKQKSKNFSSIWWQRRNSQSPPVRQSQTAEWPWLSLHWSCVGILPSQVILPWGNQDPTASMQWCSVRGRFLHGTYIRFHKHEQSPHVPSGDIPAGVRYLLESILQPVARGGWMITDEHVLGTCSSPDQPPYLCTYCSSSRIALPSSAHLLGLGLHVASSDPQSWI